MSIDQNVLFESASIGNLQLENRLVLAPMTRTSADADGAATEDMVGYYRDFAAGGFGLIVTEGIYTDFAFSQGYLNQPGLAEAKQAEAWRPIVEAVHGEGRKIVAQLMHAGAQAQGNRFRDETVAPSAVRPKGEQLAPYGGHGPYRLPRPMKYREIREAIKGFAQSAALAREAGFDGVELHAANGYLIHQFLSDYFNQRRDEWGGDIQGRMHFLRKVAAAVREAVGPDFVVGLRLSQAMVSDPEHRWRRGESEAKTLFSSLARMGFSYLHLSEPDALAPAFIDGCETLIAMAKRCANLPVIANGAIREGEQAATAIQRDGADFVAIGKAALANRDWPKRVQAQANLTEFDFGLLLPRATLDNEREWRDRTGTAAMLGSVEAAE